MLPKDNRLHILYIFLFLLVLSVLLTSSLWAADDVGKINVVKANIRQGAGTSYPLAFQLDLNQQVTIKESKDGWLLIESNRGQGWIAAWLVDVPNQKGSAREATVAENVVNIRQGPDIETTRVTQVRKGDQLEIIGQEGEWYEIKTKSGQKGWVAGWLIDLNIYSGKTSNSNSNSNSSGTTSETTKKAILVTANVVNIRQGPSISHPIITKVNGGAELAVIGQQGDWLNIRLPNGNSGWIAQWLTIRKQDPSSSETGPYLDDFLLDLGQKRSLQLKNLGDKLLVKLIGINKNDYQLGQTSDGIKLIIELRENNDLKSLVQAINNWGVEEIRLDKRAIIITFNKSFLYQVQYKENTKATEVSITYPSEQLIPVQQISFNPSENQAILQIAAARKIEYSTQNSEPNKIVIDLPQSSLQLISNDELEQKASVGPIRKVSSRQLLPDMVRIEAELMPGSLYQVSQRDDYIIIGAKMLGGASLKDKLIVLDPGHGTIQPGGWTDPGTSGRNSGVAERDINLAIALKLRDMLTSQGAKVVMTHSSGRTFLSLAGRAAIANDLNADIFVSIHCNAHANRAIQGSMTFYYAPTWHSELASQRWLRQRLATFIQQELVSYGGRQNHGIKEESYAVLRETRVPSVLVETAFLSNATEETLLNTDGFRTKVAQGILKGIEKYFQSF